MTDRDFTADEGGCHRATIAFAVKPARYGIGWLVSCDLAKEQ